MHTHISLALPYLFAIQVVSAYSPIPRWGQASVIINDALFIHGGKADQYNAYSYTAAPTSNELLFIPLSSPFSASSPPWQAVSGLTNSTLSTQSPSLAWHTLSPFNTSQALLFGGLPDVDSNIVLTGQADSADLLDVLNQLSPRWIIESTSWANEPIRRIRHTSCSSNGKIWIFGGEKADGSNNQFSDHYVFDPTTLSFKQLPSTNGPSGITGHGCVVLPNGLILLLGGVSDSSLIPLSRVWIFDTNKMSWSAITTSGTIPPPRRAFVVVLLSNGKILIHGGSDASFQTTYSDGWALDTTVNPMVWSSVDALSRLGARRDHFGAAHGSLVIFGFGYGSSAPAPADVQIYDPTSGEWVDQFTPPPVLTPPTPSLPGPTQTKGGVSPTGGHGSGGTGTISGVPPTSTVQSPSGTSKKPSSAAAIALGTTLSTLVVLGSVVAIALYIRKRNMPDSDFQMLVGDDGYNQSPYRARTHPTADLPNHARFDGASQQHNMMNSIGLGVIANVAARVVSGRSAYHAAERRDMLADEDTREFGWSYDQRHQQASSGSVWSLHSVGALFGGLKRNLWSREPSTSSTNNTPRSEKANPFSHVNEASTSSFLPVGTTSRPNMRDQSHSSVSIRSYRDPFSDPAEAEWNQEEDMEEFNEMDESSASLRLVQPNLPPPLSATMPPTTGDHTLSPLIEQTSKGSLSLSNSSHSLERVVSPFESLNKSSMTSHDIPSCAPSIKRHSSLVDSLRPSQNIRRSDTWWSRFSRTPFLDRRDSDSKRQSRIIDIRDPNPPPRLGAIEEKSVNNSSANSSRENSQVAVPLVHQASRINRHGRSQSSMQSARTADSAALERMGTVDVVQRVISESRRTQESTSSSYGTEIGSEHRRLALVTNHSTDDSNSISLPVTPSQEMMLADTFRQFTTSPRSLSPSPKTTPSAESASISAPLSPRQPSCPSSGAVAARVQEYERRMSQDQSPPTSPRSKKTGRVSVNYGLVPRPSLFVANPDHRVARSADSS